MDDLCKNFLRLIKEYNHEERLIIPLYKTLDFLYESEEFKKWETGMQLFSQDLFILISLDILNSKSINKLLAISGLIVGLFSQLAKELKKNAFLMISKLLTHK